MSERPSERPAAAHDPSSHRHRGAGDWRGQANPSSAAAHGAERLGPGQMSILRFVPCDLVWPDRWSRKYPRYSDRRAQGARCTTTVCFSILWRIVKAQCRKRKETATEALDTREQMCYCWRSNPYPSCALTHPQLRRPLRTIPAHRAEPVRRKPRSMSRDCLVSESRNDNP